MERKKVLIIDEEKYFCLLMEGYLTKKNCTVHCFQAFDEGLKNIEILRPDIIIVDINITRNVQESIEIKLDLIEGYSPVIYLTNARAYSNKINLFDEIKKIVEMIKDSFK